MREFFLRLLEKWSCKHKWVFHSRQKRFYDEEDKLPYAIYDTFICDSCGKITKIKV